MTQGVVYWKHLPGMKKETDGYIGISKHFEERMKQHHRDAFVRNSIYTIHEQMRLYGDSIKTDIIFKGNYKDCLLLENHLRPKWHIGWNMCIGGGTPSKQRWYSKLWLDTRLYNTQTLQEVTIGPNMWLDDMAKKYLPNEKLKSTTDRLAFVLYGRSPSVKNWELANAQLAQKVKERYYADFKQGYIKSNKYCVSIYKSGRQTFSKWANLLSMPIKLIMNGSQQSIKGWELATEEEWLATKERIEFK